MNPRTSITTNADDSVDVVTIDYDAGTGPFWYVEVDDTPVCPDLPLPLEHAIAAFRREVAAVAGDGSAVALVPCDEESLVWAGVKRVGEDEDGSILVGHDAEGEASC